MAHDNTNEVENGSSVMMSEVENPRENLILTAVNFLQNSKVHASPLAQKKLFLEKKGLTKAEVEIAVARSGVDEHAQLSPGNHHGNGTVYQMQSAPLPSRWAHVRDVTALIVVVGGVGGALYRFYHAVVKPYWFGTTEKSAQQQIIELHEKMVESLTKVQETLAAIQHSLTLQDERMSQLSIESGSRKTEQNLGQLRDSQFVNDLKSEVTSIKGLLLNRRQFPPTPNTTPVLPAWQRSKPADEKQPETADQLQPAKPDLDLSAARAAVPNIEVSDTMETGDQAELSSPGNSEDTTTTECQSVQGDEELKIKPEAEDTGVQASNSRVQASNTGVQDGDTGVQTSDTGVQASNTGVQDGDTGVQTSDSGVQASNTGVQDGDTGVQTSTTCQSYGVLATDDVTLEAAQ